MKKNGIILIIISLLAIGCASTPESGQNNSDKLAAIAANMEAEQASETADSIPNFLTQNFEKEETPSAIFVPYKGARWTAVTEGVVDGTVGMEYKASFLDADYSGVRVTPTTDLGRTWNWGAECTLSFDVINPNDQKIQIRLNIFDIRNTIRTYYFNLESHEARTVVISPEKFGQSSDNWSLPDGYWGGNGGLVTEKIKAMEFYLWEDNDFSSSANTFIIDNMNVKLN